MVYLAIVLLLVLGALLLRRAARTKQAWEQVARELGLDYIGHPSLDQRRHAVENSWLCPAHDRHPLTHFMTGARQGFRIDVFDYATVRDRQNYAQTVISVHLPHQRLPAFCVRQKIFDATADHWLIHEKTIPVHSLPDFAKTHILTGADSAAILEVVKPEFLGSCIGKPRQHTEGNHGRLLVYGYGQKLAPDRIAVAVNQAIALAGELEKGHTQAAAS